MSSHTSNWETVEQSIQEACKDLNAQAKDLTARAKDLTAHAERLTAQVGELETMAAQIKNCQDEAQTAELQESPIDCMNQLTTLLNQRMDRMDQGLAEIHTKMLATEFNNIARVQNSHLEHHEDSLAAFHNVITNEPIAHFPGTVGDLYTMDSAGVNSLLRELGEVPATNISNGQELLRRILGLKHIVVWESMKVQGFS